MARTKRGRRSYSAGEWGRNRVLVFPDPKTGLIQVEWRENGRRLRPFAGAPRLGTGEAAGGRVRRRLHQPGVPRRGTSRARAADAGDAV